MTALTLPQLATLANALSPTPPLTVCYYKDAEIDPLVPADDTTLEQYLYDAIAAFEPRAGWLWRTERPESFTDFSIIEMTGIIIEAEFVTTQGATIRIRHTGQNCWTVRRSEDFESAEPGAIEALGEEVTLLSADKKFLGYCYRRYWSRGDDGLVGQIGARLVGVEGGGPENAGS